MRQPFFTVFLCIMSITWVSPTTGMLSQQTIAETNAQEDEKPVSPEVIQGCYELTMSRWFPNIRLGEDEALITPPARIQLFTERGTEGAEASGYLVRAAPGTEPSVHRASYWTPKGAKKLQIVWTTDSSGLRMELKTADAEVLRGKASTFWDFSRTKQVAEVMAHRIPCGKS